MVLPKKIENWSLTSLQQGLVKTGGRLVKHARCYWLLLAESHLPPQLFGSMVRRIEALRRGEDRSGQVEILRERRLGCILIGSVKPKTEIPNE